MRGGRRRDGRPRPSEKREGPQKSNAPRAGRYLLYSFGDQITRTRRTASRAVRSASAVAGTAPVTVTINVKENPKLETAYGEPLATASKEEFSKDSIPQPKNSVNRKFSISSENSSDIAYLAAVERTDLTDREILAMALEGAVQSGQEYAVVVEEVDSMARKNNKLINANKAITVYPRSQLIQDIENAIIGHRLLDITKKGEHLFAGGRGANSQAAIRKDVLEKNIAYFWANVKWENEKSKNNSTQEPQMPSAIRFALEKAGYIDQNGRIKDMQETDGSSTRKNSLSEKTSDTAYLSAVERGDMETAIRETSPLRNEGEHGVGTGVLNRPKKREGPQKSNAPRAGRCLLYSFGDQITRTRRTASSAVRSASAVAGTAPVTSKMV